MLLNFSRVEAAAFITNDSQNIFCPVHHSGSSSVTSISSINVDIFVLGLLQSTSPENIQHKGAFEWSKNIPLQIEMRTIFSFLCVFELLHRFQLVIIFRRALIPHGNESQAKYTRFFTLPKPWDSNQIRLVSKEINIHLIL